MLNHQGTEPSPHHAALAIQVRVDLLLERGLVHISRANSDSERSSPLLRLARDVLPHGDRRVDTTALLEECADGAAGAFGGDEDDVDVLWGYDLGILFVHDGEAV